MNLRMNTYDHAPVRKWIISLVRVFGAQRISKLSAFRMRVGPAQFNTYFGLAVTENSFRVKHEKIK